MSQESRMENHLRAIRRILMYFFAFVIIYLMWLLKSLLIPLVLALFFALLLLPFMRWLINKGLPKFLAILSSALLLFTVIFLVVFLLSSSAAAFVRDYAVIEMGINAQLDEIIEGVSQTFGLDLEKAMIIEKMISDDFLSAVFRSTTDFAVKMTNFTANFFIMMIYLFAILAGLTNYERYFIYLEDGGRNGFSNQGRHVLLNAFEEVYSSLFTYMKIKFIASFVTGLGYGLVAYLFGLKFSALIGFIAFALNFIPTIGSIVATIPPALLGLFYLESGISYTIMLGILIAIQLTVGNIIEPRFQGENLGINFMTVILGLVFFGFLWGVIGMLLSVPLLVLARVILQQLPGTAWIVRLMANFHEVQDGSETNKEISA